MLDLVDGSTCPTLFHFGNADAFLPDGGVDALNAAIAGQGELLDQRRERRPRLRQPRVEMFWNEGAAKAAWAKTMAFLGRELPVATS